MVSDVVWEGSLGPQSGFKPSSTRSGALDKSQLGADLGFQLSVGR